MHEAVNSGDWPGPVARLRLIKMKMLSIIAIMPDFELLLSPAASGFGLRLGPGALSLGRRGRPSRAVSLR
jgi:hypothetical protein